MAPNSSQSFIFQLPNKMPRKIEIKQNKTKQRPILLAKTENIDNQMPGFRRN